LRLLALLIMHSSGFSAGTLGCSGKLPSLGATPPQQNKSQRATTHQVASRFASDPARGKGVRFCLPYERHSMGRRRNATDPFFISTFDVEVDISRLSALALLIMHPSGSSAGILGDCGRLPSPGATPPQVKAQSQNNRATPSQASANHPAGSKKCRLYKFSCVR
jgi:hypothetical protein